MKNNFIFKSREIGWSWNICQEHRNAFNGASDFPEPRRLEAARMIAQQLETGAEWSAAKTQLQAALSMPG